MPLSVGIVGLPNCGKSTLFNALTRASAATSPYPFCTISPNIGQCAVLDDRLDKLYQISGLPKRTYATVRFIDIAGLIKGAHQGEGLGNQFLSHIREVDIIVHLLRGFAEASVSHPEGELNPQRDASTVDLELILADMQTVEKHLEKIKTKTKGGDEKAKKEIIILEKIKDNLGKEVEVRCINFESQEKEVVENLHLLTNKKVIYVINVSEENIREENIELNNYVVRKNSEIIYLCAKLEEELSEIEEEERKNYFSEMGMPENKLDTLIKTCYKTLDLITFFTTAGEKEVRAWAVRRGTTAPEAAGKIHQDIKDGFIKGEVINYEELIKIGGRERAKEKGMVRIEGRDYKVLDGDVINFKFR